MSIGCDYCLNATCCSDLCDDNDLSYSSVGFCVSGYSAYLRTGARRPTVLMVQDRDNKGKWSYEPKYCPECGRRLVENFARWRKEGWPTEYGKGLYEH